MTQELKVLLCLTAVGIILILGLKYLFPLFAPFLLGIAFAALSEPLVHYAEAHLALQRRYAVGLVLITLLLLIVALITVAIMALYQEMERLLPYIPVLAQRTLEIGETFRQFWGKRIPQFLLFFKEFSVDPETVNQVVKSVFHRFMGFVKDIPQIFMAIGLGGISAYFFSRDKNSLSRLLYRLTPPGWRRLLFQIKAEITMTVARFFRTECALVSLTCVLTIIIFRVLGIPGAFAYGILAGMLDFLPVLGPGLIYLPCACAYGFFGNYLVAGGVIGGYLAVIVIRQVAEFRLIGANLNLHPLWTLVLIYLGMKLFGFAGIFFGPIIMITLRAFYQAFQDQEVFTG